MDIVICLLIGIASALLIFWKYLPHRAEMKEVINKAALTSITVITNTAVIVGFGSVVKGISFYQFAIDILMGSEANPYLVAAIGANIFAGILGSASGGISLVYESIGDVFLDYGQQGYNLEYIHRLAADGCGGLDSLPWNGSIVSVFAICHTTHKKSYLDAFITGLVIPMLATFAVDLPIILLLG
jgi:H+/gluconate symporter-like permease